MRGARVVGAVAAGAVALFFSVLALIDLYHAAIGNTGDTSRDVPFLFGVVFAAIAITAGLVARALGRRP